eukprot:8400658-Ditylum_brightwellii.AAC.1
MGNRIYLEPKTIQQKDVRSPEINSNNSNSISPPLYQIARDPDENAPWPRIAWLMSFPNSGTSYTLALSESATMTTTGSTYGEHHPDENGNSVPVH